MTWTAFDLMTELSKYPGGWPVRIDVEQGTHTVEHVHFDVDGGNEGAVVTFTVDGS